MKISLNEMLNKVLPVLYSSVLEELKTNHAITEAYLEKTNNALKCLEGNVVYDEGIDDETESIFTINIFSNSYRFRVPSKDTITQHFTALSQGESSSIKEYIEFEKMINRFIKACKPKNYNYKTPTHKLKGENFTRFLFLIDNLLESVKHNQQGLFNVWAEQIYTQTGITLSYKEFQGKNADEFYELIDDKFHSSIFTEQENQYLLSFALRRKDNQVLIKQVYQDTFEVFIANKNIGMTMTYSYNEGSEFDMIERYKDVCESLIVERFTGTFKLEGNTLSELTTETIERGIEFVVEPC